MVAHVPSGFAPFHPSDVAAASGPERLRGGWDLVVEPLVGNWRGEPLRVEIAALHPRIGIALLDVYRRTEGDPAGVLRRRLRAAGPDARVPHALPIVHLRLAAQEILVLADLLQVEFARRPPLTGTDPGWVGRVRAMLLDQDAGPDVPVAMGRGRHPARRRAAGLATAAAGIAIGVTLLMAGSQSSNGRTDTRAMSTPAGGTDLARAEWSRAPEPSPPWPGVELAIEVQPWPVVIGLQPTAAEAAVDVATFESGQASAPTLAPRGHDAAAPVALSVTPAPPLRQVRLQAPRQGTDVARDRAPARPATVLPSGDAIPDATARTHHAGPGTSSRCRSILGRAQLGEDPTHAEWTLLRAGCRG